MAWKNKGVWEKDDVVKYYRENVKAYKIWGPDMHYGYWEKGELNHRKATRRMNEKVVEKIKITKDDYVLDAGCGVGGNAVWLAQTFGCKVVGVSIVPEQIETAKMRAKMAGVDNLCEFLTMDYMDLQFPNETFSVVMGLESICYADPKSEFIKGVFRALRENGRFGMADGFACKEIYCGSEKRLMGRWLDGWKVNSLDTPNQWKTNAINAGFVSADYDNVTKFVMPSSRIMFALSMVSLPFHILEKFVEISDYPCDAMFHQYLAIKRGLMEYGIFWAGK
ncbi:MAG: methyltransferase domain-containing protein [Chitinispirillales bacterium]|jgi:tocopherol O-methyltransferase|nr:methyltransferase domain-containing protein [Chitinispirillales bacterium]